jgi:hypothetical protein
MNYRSVDTADRRITGIIGTYITIITGGRIVEVCTHSGPVTLIIRTLIAVICAGGSGGIKAGVSYLITLVVAFRTSKTGVIAMEAASTNTNIGSVTVQTVITGSPGWFGLWLTGISRLVAHAVITLVSRCTAIPD